MNRKHIAIAILAVWVGAMGWLVRREYFPQRDARFTGVVLNVSPGATYYRLLVGDQQVGFASSTVDTLADTVRLQDVMLWEVPTGGAVQRVEGRTVANLTRGLSLRSFEGTMGGDVARYIARGVVDSGDVIDVSVESERGTTRARVPFQASAALPMVLPMRLAFRGQLEVGASYDMELLDPMLLTAQETTVRVVAESTWVVPDSADLLEGATEWTPATYVTLRSWQVEHDLGGVPYTVWVDDLGQVVDASTPTGFHMERTAYEIAYENFENRPAVATTLPSPGVPIERRTALAAGVGPPAGDVDTLRVRVRNLGLQAFALDGGTQTRAGDTVRVVSGTPGPAYRLPFDGDSLVRRYLAADPLLASDDTRVQAQARQAIGRTRNPERAAQELVTWVHERLAKEADPGIVGAVDVLEERRGDANEHAQLFVALARAVGLPARTAAGLALVDGRFYYHAWAEVYFDDWVPVDPTFGQFPADAARLRLAIGGQAHHLDLIRMIGQLDLEVVEARSE